MAADPEELKQTAVHAARRRALFEKILEERRRVRVAPPIRRRGSEGSQALSFAQQRLWFLDQLEPGDPAYNVVGSWHLVGDLDATALDRSLKLKFNETEKGEESGQPSREEVVIS